LDDLEEARIVQVHHVLHIIATTIKKPDELSIKPSMNAITQDLVGGEMCTVLVSPSSATTLPDTLTSRGSMPTCY
jgi:hypothetical protein